MSVYDPNELDEILSDVKRLLNDDSTNTNTDSQPVRRNTTDTHLDETRMFRPVSQRPEGKSVRPESGNTQQEGAVYNGNGQYAWNDPDYIGTYYGGGAEKVVRSHAARTSSPSAYNRPVERPTRKEASPQSRQAPATQEQQPRKVVQTAERKDVPSPASRQPRREQQPTKAQQAARQVPDDDDYEDPVPKKSKKGRKILIILIILALIGYGVYSLLAKQPIGEDDSMGERKEGVSTILLAGTDGDGMRTDTLMLMTLDAKEHTASLVSIPRDTLVNGAYSVPKINGVYGINGGGEEGIEMLLQRVSECIGFQPDGYILVDLEGFVSLVDLMGGVEFDVPVDMYYNDPAQDLYIDLAAGKQTLDGEQAMGVVRFRSGYAAADLERVNVQRDFVSAAADQWMKPKTVLKAPKLMAWFGENVETDLSVGNMTWIATTLMGADLSAVETETLPGSATGILGGSYYVLSPYDVADLMNRCCNPYVRDITVDDLSIRN